MKLRSACGLALAALLSFATLASAQAPVAGWSDQQTTEFERWLKAEQDWREWIDAHRNTASRNWMGMSSRNWLGLSTDRRQRPVPPAWLDRYCGGLTADELLESTPCQKYEELKNYDFAAETIRQAILQTRSDKVEHTHFGLKRHWGFGLGYDNKAIHGSIGMQITVAEWGRWNYGILGASVGFIKNTELNPKTHETLTKNDISLFVTIASASYRIKYVPSLGMYWYVDFAQIFDVTHTLPGSQFGFSLAKK